MRELILGGSRSGKSALAERRAADSGLAVTYIATARAGDPEMAARIAHHRARRPGHWSLVEEPLQLAAVLERHAAPGCCLVVDCLTLWLSNLLCADRDGEEPAPQALQRLEQERDALLAALALAPGRIVLVSNEVGMGIVPLGALTRRFSDEAGRLNQAVAAACERVTLVVAGLPYSLKEPPS